MHSLCSPSIVRLLTEGCIERGNCKSLSLALIWLELHACMRDPRVILATCVYTDFIPWLCIIFFTQYACVLEGDRSFSLLNTCIDDWNLVFKRRTTLLTAYLLIALSLYWPPGCSFSHAYVYRYRPMSALTSQQIEGVLPLKNDLDMPIPDPLLVRSRSTLEVLKIPAGLFNDRHQWWHQDMHVHDKCTIVQVLSTTACI
jgi:hypothetical protein